LLLFRLYLFNNLLSLDRFLFGCLLFRDSCKSVLVDMIEDLLLDLLLSLSISFDQFSCWLFLLVCLSSDGGLNLWITSNLDIVSDVFIKDNFDFRTGLPVRGRGDFRILNERLRISTFTWCLLHRLTHGLNLHIDADRFSLVDFFDTFASVWCRSGRFRHDLSILRVLEL
jgi:hypothetical protein